MSRTLLVHYTFDTGDVNVGGQTVENVVNPGTFETTSLVFSQTTGISGEAALIDADSNTANAGVHRRFSAGHTGDRILEPVTLD